MWRFLQITKRIPVKKKVLLPLAACYLLLMTTVVMNSPTNTAFTSETTVEGKITINDTSDQEDAGESDDQSDKEKNKKETEKQEEKSSSSDEETENDDSSKEEEAENSDSDDEKETEDDSDETRD